MAQREPPRSTEHLPIERAARHLECESVCGVARAAVEAAGASVLRRCGRRATVAAALRIASRRAGRVELDREEVCHVLDVDPTSAELAESFAISALSPPAADSEIESLRRSTNALREVLVAAENGRSNAPRLPPSVLADAAPRLAGCPAQPLERLDLEALRAHLRRLEADLEMARLGVELYASVTKRSEAERPPR